MEHVLTRRALVAAAPAVGVAASLPGLVASAQSEDHPDAELIALYDMFKRLHAEWQDHLDQVDKLEPVWKECFEATAGTDADYWRTGRECRYDDAVGMASDKVKAVDDVANRMRAIPARTLKGLALKARLTQYDVNLSRRSEMSGPEHDWDWEVRCMEHFVREIARFADLDAVGGFHA